MLRSGASSQLACGAQARFYAALDETGHEVALLHLRARSAESKGLRHPGTHGRGKAWRTHEGVRTAPDNRQTVRPGRIDSMREAMRALGHDEDAITVFSNVGARQEVEEDVPCGDARRFRATTTTHTTETKLGVVMRLYGPSFLDCLSETFEAVQDWCERLQEEAGRGNATREAGDADRAFDAFYYNGAASCVDSSRRPEVKALLREMMHPDFRKRGSLASVQGQLDEIFGVRLPEIVGAFRSAAAGLHRASPSDPWADLPETVQEALKAAQRSIPIMRRQFPTLNQGHRR